MNQRSIILVFLLTMTTSFVACQRIGLENNGQHNPAGGEASGNKPKKTTDALELTFQDVLPVFEATCQTCHHKFSGPSMPNWLVYETSYNYKDSLKRRLTERTMPPRGFSMTDKDRLTVLAWIDSGALNTPTQPPAEPPATQPPAEPPPTTTPVNLGAQIFQRSCIGCHGPSAVDLKSPILYGLPTGYLVSQLHAYKSNYRRDSLMGGAMNSIVKNLTDEEISALSTYLSDLSACEIPETVVDPDQGSVSNGEILADEKGCLGCHNLENSADFPFLAGQKTLYINQQLLAFKSGARKNMMMGSISKNLTEGEILDLAAYMNSLRSCLK